MIVKLKAHRDLLPISPRSLLPNRAYRVLAIEADCYRLLSGDGERDGPYLYHPFFFKIIDPAEPEDWVSEFGEEGERYTRPADFGPHTWEHYFDHEPEAVQKVRAYLERSSPCFWDLTESVDLPHGLDKRTGAVERLRLLALPEEQLKLQEFFKDYELTETFLAMLVDVAPRDLRSDAEQRALQQIAALTGRIWDEVAGDRPAPSLAEFVKTKHSAELAAAATEALRVFLPAGYLRYLGQPSDRTRLPPTADDLRRAQALAATECPRRYCWFWHSLTFDWGMPVSEGCAWLEEEFAIEVNDFSPCSRCEPSAPRDHYEPREPQLLEDGFAEDRFG